MSHFAIYDRLTRWPVVNQDRGIVPPGPTEYAEKTWLPLLIKTWQLVEKYTNHRWKSTSYWRKSPSHSRGQAFDIAPDWDSKSEPFYAVSNNSDPVLYKRTKLIRQLQKLARHEIPGANVTIGLFLEPDHIHIQVLDPSLYGRSYQVVKWKVHKPIYGDTIQRAALPEFI